MKFFWERIILLSLGILAFQRSCNLTTLHRHTLGRPSTCLLKYVPQNDIPSSPIYGRLDVLYTNFALENRRSTLSPISNWYRGSKRGSSLLYQAFTLLSSMLLLKIA